MGKSHTALGEQFVKVPMFLFVAVLALRHRLRWATPLCRWLTLGTSQAARPVVSEWWEDAAVWASMLWAYACLYLCQGFSMGHFGWRFAYGCPFVERLTQMPFVFGLGSLELPVVFAQTAAGRQSRRLSVTRAATVNTLVTKQPHEAVAVAWDFTKSHVARHIGLQLILGVQLWLLRV